MSTNTYMMCAVCLDDTSTSIHFPAGPDAVCADCAKDEIVPLFLNALEHEIHYPPTWAGDQVLEWEYYRELLPANYGQQLGEKQLEYHTPNKERLYCGSLLYADDPSPGDRNSQDVRAQKMALTKGQIADAQASGTDTKTCGAFRKKANFIAVKCGHCAGHVCGQCGAPREDIMAEEACPACTAKTETVTQDDDPFEGQKRGRDYQICPNAACERTVYLGDGCNHMICKAVFCQTQFCYICGERATADSGHWNAETSRCPRFNQPNAPNATYDNPRPSNERVNEEVDANIAATIPFFVLTDLRELWDFEASHPSAQARFDRWELSNEELDARSPFLQDALRLLRQEHQIAYSAGDNGIARLHVHVHRLAMVVFTYLFRMSDPQPSDLEAATDMDWFARLDQVRAEDLHVLASHWGHLQIFDSSLIDQYLALDDAIRVAGRVWEGWATLVQGHAHQVTTARIQFRRGQWELTEAEVDVLPTAVQETLMALRVEYQEAYALTSINTIDDVLESTPHRIAFEIHDILRRIPVRSARDRALDLAVADQYELIEQLGWEQWQQNLLNTGRMWRIDWAAAVARNGDLPTMYPTLDGTVRLLSTTLRAAAEEAGLAVV